MNLKNYFHFHMQMKIIFIFSQQFGFWKAQFIFLCSMEIVVFLENGEEFRHDKENMKHQTVHFETLLFSSSTPISALVSHKMALS